jgi:hypothetical protein
MWICSLLFHVQLIYMYTIEILIQFFFHDEVFNSFVFISVPLLFLVRLCSMYTFLLLMYKISLMLLPAWLNFYDVSWFDNLRTDNGWHDLTCERYILFGLDGYKRCVKFQKMW